MTHNPELQKKIHVLPENPGVYQFYDQDGKLIYVGKAKNLKKRVSSYFNRNIYENRKVEVMVKKISDIHHIVVPTEHDALLLENNLIKQYQPRYNILLKDDKTFPWICLKKEKFPRVFLTRKVIRDGSQYFGPYTSAQMVRNLLDLIKQLYPLRTCNLNLSPGNIQAKKFKVCLKYHLGNCKGPCEGLQSEDVYNQTIQQIRSILRGHISDVISFLEKTMKNLASEYRFEEAEIVKQKLELLSKFKSKSVIVNPAIHDADVFYLLKGYDSSIINFIKVVNGAVIQSHTIEIKIRLNETDEEILSYAITELRQRFDSNAPEIIVPFLPEVMIPGVKYIIPDDADRKKLLDLSERNAAFYKLARKAEESRMVKTDRSQEILLTLQKDLHLRNIPVRIECFDNSNLQGSSPVAACVVFVSGKPCPSEYRHFHVKTVVGPDDYASMQEIVFRRYKRLIEEKAALPDLIVIDGGKGQLHAALNSLNELNLGRQIPIIGIAKSLEEIYFPNDPVPLYLDKNSTSLRLLQHIRNEAHRFGITFHRKIRSRNFLQSELDDIPNIGEKTIEKLMQNFKSIELIVSSSIDDLSKIIGKNKARIVYDHFHKA